MHAHMHSCMCMHAYTHRHTHSSICMCTHTLVQAHVCMCTHTHTHMLTFWVFLFSASCPLCQSPCCLWVWTMALNQLSFSPSLSVPVSLLSLSHTSALRSCFAAFSITPCRLLCYQLPLFTQWLRQEGREARKLLHIDRRMLGSAPHWILNNWCC